MNRANQLFEAIRQDNIKKVRKLLAPSWFGLRKAYGVNGNVGSGDLSPLIFASSAGRTEIAKLLLDYGANVNYQDKSGYSALMWAASNGYTQIVEMLINNGADVNKQNRYGNNALILATRGNYTEIVSLLTLHHAEINVISHLDLLKGDTPLTIAVRNKNYEIVNMFISKGADVNVKNDYGNTALRIALERQNVEMVKILVKAGADTDGGSFTGFNVLQYAISYAKDESADLELVKPLINANNINKPYSNGDSPVKQALSIGHTKIADWLIANGAIISSEERENIELERKQQEEKLRLGYFCKSCGCYKSEREVEEDAYEQDEWITIYYLYCKTCGSKITDKQGNRVISRVKN